MIMAIQNNRFSGGKVVVEGIVVMTWKVIIGLVQEKKKEIEQNRRKWRAFCVTYIDE